LGGIEVQPVTKPVTSGYATRYKNFSNEGPVGVIAISWL